jgi:GNAT superfamily N-acetyltransferase
MQTDYRIIAESIETGARRDFFAAAPPQLGCAALDVPGTTATLLRVQAMPSPMMNRVVGLPDGAHTGAATLDWIRQAYGEAGVEQFWLTDWEPVQPAPQPAWVLLLRDLSDAVPAASPDATLRVRLARDDERELGADILCRSFGMPAIVIPWMAALVGRPGWRIYFACDADDAPVATGALYIDGERAWLGMTATLPQARRQGAQHLLLAARLADAKAAGCVVAGIETEAPGEGEVKPALNNILRAGFRQVGLRQNHLFHSSPS